jgi:hypothetical protein
MRDASKFQSRFGGVGIMRMEDELLADARREADHAREELIKARDLLARVQGAFGGELLAAGPLPVQDDTLKRIDAFMAETTLYPKAPVND